jgi:YbgC/YbaW family acyl-CoA thioester hydrolase
MAYEHRYHHRVEFSETDMAGIVHFSNYFRYMEAAEHAFLRSLGILVHRAEQGRAVSWPRVHAECSYEAPLRFEDDVEVRLLVRNKRRSVITYEFHLFHGDSREQVARGSLTAVCVQIDPANGKMTPIAIPESIDRLIDVAPPELLSPFPSGES